MLSCFIKCGDDAGCVVLMVWLFLNNDSCDVFSRYKCTIQTTLCVRRGFNAREIVCIQYAHALVLRIPVCILLEY